MSAKAGSDSGVMAAAAAAPASTRRVRVRLMVAVPGVIVLLLVLLAGVLYWLTDAYTSNHLTRAYVGSEQDFARDWLKVLWVFLVGGGLIGYLLAWSLTRPIHDIIRLSERVASGDLRTKVPVRRDDEMGQLGSSFNYMLESLNNFIETRNRFILESFTGGLIVTDLNGTITAVNSAAEKLLDLRNEDVNGKSVRAVFSRPGLSDLLRYHERAIWKQETIVDKRLNLELGGKVVSVILGFTPMRDSSGTIFGVIINVRDRVEMERFYEHLRNADRLATMGTFASGLAHEIRNPLGAIKGTAQLLQEDLGPNSSASEYLHIITKEVNRLDALVREVQAYSQPATEMAPTDINLLIKETIRLAQSDERHKSRDVSIETDLQALPRVRASKHQLRQALMNILLNAMEATPDGGVVKISAELIDVTDRPLRIRVSNPGDPLPAEIHSQIFEPFYTTKATGTGLGLPIAAQVTANHGGKLSLDYEGGMVIFTMLIPSEVTPKHIEPEIPV